MDFIAFVFSAHCRFSLNNNEIVYVKKERFIIRHFRKGESIGIVFISVVAKTWGRTKINTTEGNENISLDNGNILYFDCGGGYTTA